MATTNPKRLTATQLLEKAAAGAPEKVLVYDAGAVATYAEVLERSTSFARGLVQRGLEPGARVVTLIGNEIGAVEIILGLAAAGVAYTPLISSDVTDEELRFFFRDSEPAAVVADAEYLARLDALDAETLPGCVIVRDVGRGDASIVESQLEATIVSYEELARVGGEAAVPLPAVDPDSTFAILYTSGSTARPKGVDLSHASFVACSEIWARQLQLTDEDVVLGVLPLFHAGGLFGALGPAIACGGGLMLQKRFSVSSFLDDVRASGATAGILLPSMIAMLMSYADDQELDCASSLRTIVTHFQHPHFEERFGVVSVLVWTMSELAIIGTFSAPQATDGRQFVVGYPMDPLVEIEIRDDEGHAVATGEAGEIVCRHPWLMAGYHNNPEETSRALGDDGWMRTGDLGRLGDDGALYYLGRLKNMIKRSGENISAVEVEETVRRMETVKECTCFGVPDTLRTEEVKVVIVPEDGAELSEVEVVGWCRERLASFKVPRYVEIRPEVDRTATMKVDLAALKREHEANPGWDRLANMP